MALPEAAPTSIRNSILQSQARARAEPQHTQTAQQPPKNTPKNTLQPPKTTLQPPKNTLLPSQAQLLCWAQGRGAEATQLSWLWGRAAAEEGAAICTFQPTELGQR